MPGRDDAAELESGYISIPRQFKRLLKRRFSRRNIKKVGDSYILGSQCPLCEHYKECRHCPFGPDINGCYEWLDMLNIDSAFTKEQLEEKVRRIRAMEEYIIWT